MGKEMKAQRCEIPREPFLESPLLFWLSRLPSPSAPFPSRTWRRRGGSAVRVCDHHLRSPSQAHQQPGGDPSWTPLPQHPNNVSPCTYFLCPPSASSTFASRPSTQSPILCSNPATEGLSSSPFPGRATLKKGMKICLDPHASINRKIIKKLMGSKLLTSWLNLHIYCTMYFASPAPYFQSICGKIWCFIILQILNKENQSRCGPFKIFPNWAKYHGII